MLDNHDQPQPQPTDDQAPVPLPWDVVQPEDEGLAAESDLPNLDSDIPNLKSEISDSRSQISDSGSQISDVKLENPDSSAEISDSTSPLSDAASPVASSFEASRESAAPRRIALPVLADQPPAAPRTIALPVIAAAVSAVETAENAPIEEDKTGDLPICESSAVEPQDQPLPWSIAAAPDITDAPVDLPAEPQPPALAYAPAFLAIDDEGLPIPDEIADQLDVEIPSLPPETLEPEGIAAATADLPITPSGSGIWTIPLMCIGIAILAACLLIPQADKNRRLAWEREGLRCNLEQLQKQVEINENFLGALSSDRFLAKRLAQRQLNVVPAGTTILELDGIHGTNASPFQLVTVPPPPPLPEYQPIGGRLAELCRNPQTQLYLIGGSLFAIAAGLVLGRDRPDEIIARDAATSAKR